MAEMFVFITLGARSLWSTDLRISYYPRQVVTLFLVATLFSFKKSLSLMPLVSSLVWVIQKEVTTKCQISNKLTSFGINRISGPQETKSMVTTRHGSGAWLCFADIIFDKKNVLRSALLNSIHFKLVN